MSKRQRTEPLFCKPFAVLSECPPKEPGKRVIGTHDGTFHCDEALGCAFLQMLPEWAGSTIVRTRNEAELAKCDVSALRIDSCPQPHTVSPPLSILVAQMVIDVGAVYDHSIRRFDHHQRTFVSTLKEEHPDVPPDARPDFSTKLSACGLVYKHYGLQELLPALTGSLGVPSTLLPVLYRKMYKGFVEEVWTSRYLAWAIAWIAPQAKQ